MCYGEHYRKVESFDRIIIGPFGIKGTGMSYNNVETANAISKAFLPEIMNEDQHYRRKYRNALVEIKLMIEPYTNKSEIKELCREINEVLKRCGI